MKIWLGSGTQNASKSSTSPVPAKSSISALVSSRTWSASRATDLGENSGSSNLRKRVCSAPSRSSGISGRLPPRLKCTPSVAWTAG